MEACSPSILPAESEPAATKWKARDGGIYQHTATGGPNESTAGFRFKHEAGSDDHDEDKNLPSTRTPSTDMVAILLGREMSSCCGADWF